MFKTFFFLFIVLLINSCTLFERNIVDAKLALASVENNYLYIEDIVFSFIEGDSAQIIENQINDWIRNQLLLKSSYNSNINMDKINNQVLKYRNNLIIFEYEKNIYQKYTNNTASKEEIKTYYENNTEDFILKFDIIKALYAKIPKEAPNISGFRKLLKNYPKSDINKIRSYCFRFAEKSYLEDTVWIKFDDVLFNNPLILIENKSHFLQTQKYIESSDNNYYFFIKILDKRIVGENAPLSFESNIINAIILNKKKQEIFDKLRDSIFVNSKKGIDYEIY
jgi:hypothetical protein|tara:strand:- start:670 stop:1509 length:840 start_codon:yes stop_codon:yes gene_type:complete